MAKMTCKLCNNTFAHIPEKITAQLVPILKVLVQAHFESAHKNLDYTKHQDQVILHC
jgi:hypothetical protein